LPIFERLAYFWNGFGLGNNSNSFTIYMGHTSQSAFASNTDWIPFSALQQVYVGQPELLRQAGWIELVLQNPFHYNNTDNLIIAAHESNPGGNEEGGTFYNTICTENRSLQKRGTSLIPDPAAPPAGMLVNAYPNTKLYFGDIPNTPVLAIQPLVLDFGIRAPNVPSPAQSILLMNQGLGILHLTEADISFWGTDASLFSADTSIFPLALAAGESASLELFFCPNSDGNKNASLRIAYAGENHDILLKGYALASGIVNIGNGSYLDTAYFGAFEPAVRFQVLYTSQELLAAGAIPGQAIEQLSFSLSCQTYRYLSNCLIRFKNTNSDVLTGFEGDAESFTTCFANSHLFSYSGWQYFNLETPYVWDGTGNLLLDISYICPGANLSVGAYSALAPNKVWYVHGNTDDAAALGGGGTRGNRIKTRFIFAPALESPPYCYIHPANYHFNDVYIGSSQSKTLSVINTGNSSLNITNISIAGDPAFSLGNLPNLPLTLASGHSFPLEVIYSPTALGVNNATVTLTDDQNTRYILGRSSSSAIRRREQNSRNTYTIALSGNCADYITIGEGTQDEHIPLNFYMGASLYETIFTNAELSGFEGMITGIKLYNSFATALSKPVQIWLGTTTQTNLAANWIPATELNLVYDDFIYFPAGANTIQINFTEPFMYQDCQNLVMMLKRPYEQMYNDYVSYFKCQTGAQNRARILYNDFVDYNAFNPPLSPTTGVYPRTTFLVIPGRVGHITGTVLGEDNEPLEGVTVLLAGREQSVQTDVQGQFCFPNLSPGEYSLSFSKFAYIDQSQLITLASDENTALNIFMQPMPRVSVSGNIVANDTGAGIEGAEIRLTGYDSYFTYSLANGSFSIPDVFAFETYDYLVSKAGYIPARGIVDLEGAASEMGDIVLNEIAYKPTSVSAHLSEADLRVLLSWEAPDPDAFELYESFEDTVFPPEAWSQIITNTGDANSLGVYPTWCQLGVVNIENDAASPTEGAWQAGLWWTISHQDEWLITPSFVCPPDARISFDTYASYGSQYGDHYYLKISLDNGASWIPLWDASVLPTGTNHYQYPVSVDLSNYAGNDLLLAFHALDPPAQTGLWHPWFIDNIYIGNMNYSIRFSEAELSRGKISRGAPKAVKSSTLSLNAQPDKSLNRALLGYKIWRLPTGQENNESTWVSLTQEPITHLNFVDSGWQSLNDGSYNWAVKAVYSANVLSAAAISNALVKAQHNGIVVGYVRRSNNQGIPAAMITASNGHSATTNNAGAYSMVLPVGEYSLTASANGYHPLTVDEVMITESQNVTVNFVLTPLANEDEIAPVLATALKGNYPNPFNPETTIYYEIKDAIPVCLEIYNLKGQKLRTLVNEVQAMGRYRIVFDGKDARKLPLPSGVYLYRFSAGEYRKMRKMILLQ
ncbi:MAG: carboxypeptidase regulatory-like domain-containing protein, partial [Candidatus Cloacimonetes bacterium]|nr:carboxypeptidase regulatory-like domain-containing protein [Candidatus Cloacimonadota bacterium]